MITQSGAGRCLARRSYSEGGCRLVSGQHRGRRHYVRGWKPLSQEHDKYAGAASSREKISNLDSFLCKHDPAHMR